MWCVLVLSRRRGPEPVGLLVQPASRAPTGSCRGSRVGPCLGAIGRVARSHGTGDLTLQAAEQNARRQVADFQACAWILLDAFNCLVFPLSMWVGAHVCFWATTGSVEPCCLLCCCCLGYTLTSCAGRSKCPSPHIVALSQFSRNTLPTYSTLLPQGPFITAVSYPLPRSLQQRGLSWVVFGAASGAASIPSLSCSSHCLSLLQSSAVSQALLFLGP